MIRFLTSLGRHFLVLLVAAALLLVSAIDVDAKGKGRGRGGGGTKGRKPRAAGKEFAHGSDRNLNRQQNARGQSIAPGLQIDHSLSGPPGHQIAPPDRK